MGFSDRLRERREQLGLKQSELAKQLGITPGAVGNYENNVSTPRADILFKVFDVLKCDANYLFQDEMKELTYKDTATPEEFEKLVKPYRDLDPHGRDMVNTVLAKEHSRCQSESNIVELPSRKENILNAAHERTDIEITEEMRKHDDDIMADDNLWK